MATSVLMAAPTDRQTRNSSGQRAFPPQDQDQDQDQPIRRSSGRRRKTKGGETPPSSMAVGQPKKIRQRGMGVEKLERHRIQEEWRRMTEINRQSLADPANLLVNSISSTVGLPAPVPQISRLNQNQNGYLGFHGQIGFSNSDLQFGIENQSEFLGKNVVTGFHKELSSTQNFVNCFSQHCNACHKKKKVNDGLNITDSHHHQTIKQENHGPAATKQGVEVVAVHRKALSGGKVVMEYDFFPSSEKADSDDETKLFGSSTSASSNCIDLSLKLSY